MDDSKPYMVLMYVPNDGIMDMWVFDRLDAAENKFEQNVGLPEDESRRTRLALVGPIDPGSNVMDAAVLRYGDARRASHRKA